MLLGGGCAARSLLPLLLLHPAPRLGPCAARCAAARACEGAASEESPLEESRREELERLERCLRVATLETSAEQAESEQNLLAAIAAYEELLALQPPCAPELREQDAARWALQAPHPCSPPHDSAPPASPPGSTPSALPSRTTHAHAHARVPATGAAAGECAAEARCVRCGRGVRAHLYRG